MRRHMYLLTALAAASFATASAQNAQNQGTSNRRTPPAQQAVPPTNTTVVPPNTTPQSNPAAKNPNVQRDRVPPAARGVGASNRPNCSTMKGLEKAECERRDTSRDDLPAGVTATQPKKPSQ